MSQPSNPTPKIPLQHLSYLCPGLHEKGARQDIYPLSFGNFFSRGESVIIPLFQRTYCWSGSLIPQWFSDVWHGTRINGMHSTGNIYFKRSAVDNDRLVCIDGQQRLTTSLLFFSSIRDIAIQLLSLDCDLSVTSKLTEIISKCRKIFFTSVEDKDLWVESSKHLSLEDRFPPGKVLNFFTFLPSYVDRKPFFEIIMLRELYSTNEDFLISEITKLSLQAQAKFEFDSLISRHVGISDDKEFSISKSCDALESLFDLALNKMSMMYIEMITPINMAQVFLWLQEKTLFGMGSLLYNPTPGIDFKCSDLIRNLLISEFMNLSTDQQEQIYKNLWLMPLEFKFPKPEQIDKILSDFVKVYRTDHESELEKTVKSFLRQFNRKAEGTGIYLYAKFYSLYDDVKQSIETANMPPPSSIDNSILDRLANTNTVNALLEKIGIKVPEDQAGLRILDALLNFISSLT